MSVAPLERRSTSGQLMRFLVIGGSNVCIDLVVYQLLLTLGLTAGSAKTLSYLAGMVSGYFGNKFWTFQVRSGSVREPIAYALVYAFGLAANVLVNAAVLAFAGESQKALAFFAATAVSTALNFIGLKYIAFRERAVVPARSIDRAVHRPSRQSVR